MTQPMEYIEYLSKEIGARPAGTEEEQDAALYIADEFQKDAGFAASIEEFTSTSNLEGGRAILCMVTIVVSILAMLFNILTIPALILAIIAAVIYVLEAYDRPVMSKFLARGASQNVIAKYQPFNSNQGEQRGNRKRKIVLVAHYDTGKVAPGVVQKAESMGLPLSMLCLAAMVAAAFFLILRLFVGGTGGVGLIFVNILTIIAIVILALPILKAILYRAAPYNEGANNNASGVAALLEVAKRIASGSISEADLVSGANDVVIHGAEAAMEAGLVPEGADLSYEAAPTLEETESYSEEERLLAAKAAIAAFTGQRIEQRVYAQVSTEKPQEPVHDDVLADFDEDSSSFDSALPVEQPSAAPSAAAPIPAAVPAVSDDAEGFENAPSWFVAAQKNAKRSETSAPVQRSRYTEAIQATERELAERDRKRREQEKREQDEARRAAITAMQPAASAEADEADREAAAVAANVVDISGQFAGAGADVIGQQPEAEVFEVEEVAGEAFDAAAAPNYVAEAELELEDAVVDSEVQGLPAVDEPADDEQMPDLPEAFDEEEPEYSDGPVDMTEEAQEDQPLAGEPAGLVEDGEEDLGQTIAYSPHALKRALQEEAYTEADGAQVALEAEEEPAGVAYLEEDEVPSRSRGVRSSLAGLPSIEGGSVETEVPENTNPSRSGLFRMLRTDVPSLSGIIEPVTDEMLQKAALDSAELPKIALDEEAPVSEDVVAGQETAGAHAQRAGQEASEQPHKADLPPVRSSRFARTRREKGDELTDTPQEWLSVDDDFEAREVGRKRGSWESFREDSDEGNRTWEGGAFSRLRLGHVSTKSGEDETADIPEELVETPEDHQISEEIEQIYHFRNPDYDAEIWFVAIGSDTEQHDGAKAFIDEHKAELRGAMIIEVESLGAGYLSVASEEGQFRKMQASSRIKRFTRGASEATGIVLDQVQLAKDSITTTFQKAGMQAMHLMGAEDGLPALKGSADDIYENVDELIFEENVSYLMELLKQE